MICPNLVIFMEFEVQFGDMHAPTAVSLELNCDQKRFTHHLKQLLVELVKAHKMQRDVICQWRKQSSKNSGFFSASLNWFTTHVLCTIEPAHIMNITLQIELFPFM